MSDLPVEVEALDESWHLATSQGLTWTVSTAESYLNVSGHYTVTTISEWLSLPEVTEIISGIELDDDLQAVEEVDGDPPICGIYLHPVLAPLFLGWADPPAVYSGWSAIHWNQIYQHNLEAGYRLSLEAAIASRASTVSHSRPRNTLVIINHHLDDPERYDYRVMITYRRRVAGLLRRLVAIVPTARVVGCVSSRDAHRLWGRYLERHRGEMELNQAETQWSYEGGQTAEMTLDRLARLEV